MPPIRRTENDNFENDKQKLVFFSSILSVMVWGFVDSFNMTTDQKIG